MNAPRVELVYFTGCPNVQATRDAIQEAMGAAGLPAEWQEWNCDAPGTPEGLRHHGSPTVLVNGRDIDPISSDSCCCRVYAGPEGLRSAPDAELIRAAIAAAFSTEEEGEL